MFTIQVQLGNPNDLQKFVAAMLGAGLAFSGAAAAAPAPSYIHAQPAAISAPAPVAAQLAPAPAPQLAQVHTPTPALTAPVAAPVGDFLPQIKALMDTMLRSKKVSPSEIGQITKKHGVTRLDGVPTHILAALHAELEQLWTGAQHRPANA